MSKNRQMNIRLSDVDYKKIQSIASQTNRTVSELLRDHINKIAVKDSEPERIRNINLNRMGIDTKNIDMRKVEPVYIDLASLKNSQIDSPLRYAEKSLESLNQSMRNRAMPKDELEALKAQRATLEANVEEAKQKQVVEQPKQEQKKQKRHEQDSGFSL